ncbi:PH domain-containing protein [Parabacteroides timonensis]|uniref:PH domain-containing protein n=1 Tax=Parabacteroides timonensis TaxID=1871013 RepID=UPI00094E1561|nr:PH domain-containing protein [Parabacteroides timonensis]
MISDLQADITLKPKLGYWVSKYFVIIVVASLLPFPAIYWNLEMPVHYALMGLFLVVWIMLCYTYIDTLFATKWIITKDELIFRHGIVSRREDHLELYRVIDYSEKQSFLQLIFHNKTVKVISGDASDPVLYMYGIDQKTPIIGPLRDRVKIARKESGIFEVTNRS